MTLKVVEEFSIWAPDPKSLSSEVPPHLFRCSAHQGPAIKLDDLDHHMGLFHRPGFGRPGTYKLAFIDIPDLNVTVKFGAEQQLTRPKEAGIAHIPERGDARALSVLLMSEPALFGAQQLKKRGRLFVAGDDKAVVGQTNESSC